MWCANILFTNQVVCKYPFHQPLDVQISFLKTTWCANILFTNHVICRYPFNNLVLCKHPFHQPHDVQISFSSTTWFAYPSYQRYHVQISWSPIVWCANIHFTNIMMFKYPFYQPRDVQNPFQQRHNLQTSFLPTMWCATILFTNLVILKYPFHKLCCVIFFNRWICSCTVHWFLYSIWYTDEMQSPNYLSIFKLHLYKKKKTFCR
jgi:hypothetical protein